jgi:ferredoxin-nitrate reductase
MADRPTQTGVPRIAGPWGPATPYGAGEDWPVRVDMMLEAGVSEDDVERWVPSASVLHSNGDAMDIAVRGDRIVGVRGRAGDRVNRGRLDPKDLFGWQAVGSADRLTRPLVRRGGRLVESDWDEAMGVVVDRSRELLDEPGGGGGSASIRPGSCFSRSTTRSRSWGRPGSARPTWTATRGCARPPPPRR